MNGAGLRTMALPAPHLTLFAQGPMALICCLPPRVAYLTVGVEICETCGFRNLQARRRWKGDGLS